MRKKFIITIILIIFFLIVFIYFFKENSKLEIKPVSGANNIEAGQVFTFTISPDNRWLVFFERINYNYKLEGDKIIREEKDSNKHYLYGNLRIIDLLNEKKYEIDVPSKALQDLISENCWSKDPLYGPLCIFGLIVPEYQNYIENSENYIEINETGEPTLIVSGKPLSQRVPLEETCSDCYIKINEKEIIGKYISNEFTDVIETGGRFADINIISHDQSKIYYQKGRDSRKVTLYEYDINSNTERNLVSFSRLSELCTYIDELRLSPNQRFIAFQVSYGCQFTSAPKLYVYDIYNDKLYHITDKVYYNVHWNSKSDRLYFWKCEVAGECTSRGNGIYYAEFIY